MKSHVVSLTEALPVFFKAHSFSQLFILTDDNTYKHCYPLVRDLLPEHHMIKIKSGEEYKSLDTCQYIWQELTTYGADRSSLMVNLGGGVVGDIGGFCAATFKRGIAFVHIPTTLLAMVDASIGGKTGINYKYAKNQIGVFENPMEVFTDPVFLATLSDREIKSGFAEIVKHTLIDDAQKWEAIRNTPWSQVDFKQLITDSKSIKLKIVARDFHDHGHRKILNLGHTIGHALESYFFTQKRVLLHGEAVAIGLICETYISYLKGYIGLSNADEIKQYLSSMYKKIRIDSAIEPILTFIKQDKKNLEKKYLGVGLAQIGEAIFNVPFYPTEIEKSIRYYME